MKKEDVYVGMKVVAEIDGGHCTGIVECIDGERCGIEFFGPIGYQRVNVDDIVYEVESDTI